MWTKEPFLVLFVAALGWCLPADTTTSRYQPTSQNFSLGGVNSSGIFLNNNLVVEERKIRKKTNKDQLLFEKISKESNTSIISSISSSTSTTSKIGLNFSSTPTTLKPSTTTFLKLNDSTKLVVKNTKPPFKIRLTNIRTTTRPIFVKTTSFVLTKPTTKVPTSTQKSFTTKSSKIRIKNSTRRSTKKPKPTIKKIVTKWSDKPPSLSDLKQNWYEEGVPYPNPSPEVTSFSPPFAISDVPPILPPIQDEPISPLQNTQPIGNILSNPISTFNLDMIPDLTRNPNGGTSGGSPCPTVHISSSVLGAIPQGRQDCSDLNLVINSHYMQNMQPTRTPGINTYDGTGAGGTGDGAVVQDAPIEDAPVAEDPGAPLAADPASGAATSGGSPGGGSSGGGFPNAGAIPNAGNAGSGGTGGSGGSGGDGSDGGGEWKFPDMKHLFEAIGYIWNGLGHLLSPLRNPWLYIIPAVLSFLLGLIKILALFPWWIPLLVLYVGIKSNNKPPPPAVTFQKHVHRPTVIHHKDGWFWNHQTKSWDNVLHRNRFKSREDVSQPEEEMLDDKIEGFGEKFESEKKDDSWFKWKKKKR